MSYEDSEEREESYMGTISNLILRKDIDGLRRFLEIHKEAEDLKDREREYAEKKLKELEDELNRKNINSSDRDER